MYDFRSDIPSGRRRAFQSLAWAKVADFAQLTPDSGRSPVSSLDGLLDIRVEVTAELGRVSIPIGDILKMSVGSVLELDRLVSEPVDLFVQGRRG